MSEPTINDFSLLCRLFGNLFYRAPNDPILASTFDWLCADQLRQNWALSLDAQSENALATVQKSAHPTELIGDYQALFGEKGAICPSLSEYGVSLTEFETFRSQRAMPALANADHVALLLLTASWIEDNLASTQAQQDFFSVFLLPAMAKFLGKVEAFDGGFYKALAQLARDALSAMADELEEAQESD